MKRAAIASAVVALLALVLLVSNAFGAHLHHERWYQERWCNEHGGVMEYELADHARVDCLTDDLALEVDFGTKWAESVGQSVFYAAMTQRRPAILLILEHGLDDIRYAIRIQEIDREWHLGIDLYLVDRDGNPIALPKGEE